VTVTPAANQSGTATITVTVTDGNGGTGSDTFVLNVVVNNPTSGYEYGAGSFSSPAGAYTANPSLAGSATITQLYARYATDGTMTYPSNAFRFSYSPGGMSFTSTGMTSLVISGKKSWLRGEGIKTVNGVNEQCYYLLSVVDSTSSPDRVRVKIWSKATGQVVYDTQKNSAGVSAPDDADATQATSNPGTVAIIP
jgi:large repetitive protein